jgi:hypothetical protein
MKTDSKYWAALPSADFAGALTERIDNFYQYLQRSGRLVLWQRAHAAWHAGAGSLGKVGRAGQAGELTVLKANHLRNIGTHTVNMITAQRPAFDCKATNNDYESGVQTKLAQSILDYDMRSKRLEDVARMVVEYAVQLGEGWGLKVWDTMAGEPWGIDPATAQPILSGAMRYIAVSPIDVVRDPSSDGNHPSRWCAVRRWENRYDLMAKYAGKAQREAISGAKPRNEVATTHYMLGYDHTLDAVEADEVEVWEFYHDRTEALPDGRRCIVVGEQVLDDGPLPYRRMPVFRMTAGYQAGTNFGYSIIFDLLPLQEAVDALVSTVASNQAAFGVQSILVPKGHGMSVAKLAQGLQVMTYDPGLGEPKPLQLVKTAPETFQFLGQLVSMMETLSGISSVVRGDPAASLKSGSALAMVAAQSLQYTVNLQASYVAFLEDVSTGAVEDYQDFATLPQVVLIAGKSNRTRAKEWKGSDIAKVTRVQVDIGNALSKTLAGRSEMATQLVQAGLVSDPRVYIEVLTTGRLEPATEGASSELLLIAAENELLQEGTEPMPVATDDHVLHIKEHKVVMASPQARENPNLVGATLGHMQQHIELLMTVDPTLLQALGIPVPPSNAGAVPPPGDPNAPPGAEGAGPPPPAEPLPPGPPGAGGGPDYVPPMPQMPQNPQTGQRVPAPPTAVPPAA